MGNRRFEHRAGICTLRAAVVLGSVLLAGCATAPWPWAHNSQDKQVASDANPNSSAPPKSSGSQADAEALKQVMAELQQVGALDPAAQEKLMADLKQVDPSLWPMVLQTFRAEAAYKRREEQREAERKKEGSTAASKPRKGDDAVTTVAGEQETRFELKSASASGLPASPSSLASSSLRTHDSSLPSSKVDAAQPNSLASSNLRTQDSTLIDRPALAPDPPLGSRVDAGNSAAAVATAKPGETSAAPPQPLSTAQRLAATRGEASAGAVASAGTAAAGTPPTSEADWHNHLTAAIRSIELESKAGSKSESDIALQARLRMLYLLAGRRDDAMRPLPAAAPAAQDYWSSQIYGLSTWMDAEKTPDSGRRAAETKRILGEALAQLGETAPLAVRNLTFCTEILRFGAFEAAKSTEFIPGQKVLVYAEVDNLHVASSTKGYHWAVKIDGQIFDGRGNRMTDYGPTSAEETYQTPRHDFFVSKLYYLPRLVPGRYTLQLTIEDTLGHKVGQSSIDFTVKPQ